jgi:hypothetical protein
MNEDSENPGTTRPELLDRDIRVWGTFRAASGGPVCPVCRSFEQDEFAGWIPYPLAGLDVSEWPCESTEQIEVDNLYPCEILATSACPCTEFLTWNVTATLNPDTRKPELGFQLEERDRVSRLKGCGAMGWLPNYRD